MPFIHVSSNVPAAGVDTARAIRELSKSLATALGRPEPSVMVQLSLDQAMLFAGSDEVRSIGRIDPERNAASSQLLSATILEVLGVPADRVFLSFDDIAITNWGARGTTVDKFMTIEKKKMPYIHVSSNVAAAGVDTDAVTRALSKSLAGSLGAPEQLLLAKLSLGSPMLMAKKSDPCAFVEIRSVKIDPSKNPAVVKAVTETVSATLGVSPKRVFVNLQQIDPTHWGFNGVTAASRL